MSDVHLHEGETCEACGYTKPVKRDPLPRRQVTTYGVVVPDDAEIGTEILDDWVSQFAAILGLGSDLNPRLVRYHAITAVLAWAMQNQDVFVADVREAALA